MSILRIAAILLLFTGCELLGIGADLTVEFETLGNAEPPDTLELEDPLDWYDYPPIVEVEGARNAVFITGDYTMSCAGAKWVGTARYNDRGGVEVVVDHECAPKQFDATPKLAFRARLHPLPAEQVLVTVKYDIWDSQSFGGLPTGVQTVLTDTVTVR